MDRQSAQKAREKLFLKQFIEHNNVAVEEIQECEPPDFIIATQNGQIGVEVSEVFKPAVASKSKDKNYKRLPQAAESLADNILRNARNHYFESGGAPIRVQCCTSYGFEFEKFDYNEKAKLLAEFLSNNSNTESDEKEFRLREIDARLANLFSYIRVVSVPTQRLAHWIILRAGFSRQLTTEIVQNEILKKERLLASYKSKVPVIWLLLVADCRNPSRMFNIKNGFEIQPLHSDFDRIFFFLYPEMFTLTIK